MEIDDLLRRQAQLQAEAATVRQDLGLDQRLSTLGEVVPVGSAALGLMVWRDLDLTVVCHRLDAAAAARTGALLAGHPRVREVRFIDDTGDWNTDPTYPDGLYLGLGCRSLVGEIWKVDIWFVDDPDRQPDLAHVRDLPRRLTAETRAAILGVSRPGPVDPNTAGRSGAGTSTPRCWTTGCGRPRSSRPGCGAGKADPPTIVAARGSVPGIRPGLRRSVVVSGSSEADPKSGRRSVWVAGVAAQRGGDVDRPDLAEHSDGQVAQAGHDIGSGAGADPGGVLTEGDIAKVV
jgi:hypothetical protein